MLKIIKYSMFDMMRSRWNYIYFLFYFILASILLFLNSDLAKGVITLMNITLILVPLIATIFGVMYYYDSREFATLLLALPIKRWKIFLGQYFGLSISLVLSLVLGLGIPFAIYGLFGSGDLTNFIVLMVVCVCLTFIFVALAYLVTLYNENKVRGFGYAILIWLFIAIVYDGIFLLGLVMFNDYPLENFALVSVLLNPIDLSRILILLKLDIAALLGYTGAVFKSFFGTGKGMIISSTVLLLWMILPIIIIKWKASRKDF